ncbi:hypothetical protein [Candidatus Poriferisodalis sp.]|uniref:hypothetical protein n=1 Tax=Candidatus Poriferisodalis sp. TaxID=3101277 RepID=UPI003B597EBC
MPSPSDETDRDFASPADEIPQRARLWRAIDASTSELVDAKRRLELAELIAEPIRFDFAAAEEAWGGNS